MKLFITNKDHFQSSVGERYRKAHKDAFNTLQIDVSNSYIPIILLGYYSEDAMCCFEFKNKKNDIYFYEFLQTAS